MSKFSDLCVKYFKVSCFYEILGIEKNADEQQVRKAYHKLSLKVHPDRVEDEDKAEATEKFKLLGRIYSVLNNTEKRAIYDQTGTVDDDEDSDSDFDWLNFWQCIFKPISHKQYREYEEKYKDSEEELYDLRKAYVNGKGDMDFILEAVPFTNCDDEPRIKSIIEKLIKDEELPEFDCFLNESPKKAARRRRKYEKEAREAELIASPVDKEESGEEALRQMIASRQKTRCETMSNFYDQLAAKYGGETKEKKSAKTKKAAIASKPASKRKRT